MKKLYYFEINFWQISCEFIQASAGKFSAKTFTNYFSNTNSFQNYGNFVVFNSKYKGNF